MKIAFTGLAVMASSTVWAVQLSTTLSTQADSAAAAAV